MAAVVGLLGIAGGVGAVLVMLCELYTGAIMVIYITGCRTADWCTAGYATMFIYWVHTGYQDYMGMAIILTIILLTPIRPTKDKEGVASHSHQFELSSCSNMGTYLDLMASTLQGTYLATAAQVMVVSLSVCSDVASDVVRKVGAAKCGRDVVCCVYVVPHWLVEPGVPVPAVVVGIPTIYSVCTASVHIFIVAGLIVKLLAHMLLLLLPLVVCRHYNVVLYCHHCCCLLLNLILMCGDCMCFLTWPRANLSHKVLHCALDPSPWWLKGLVVLKLCALSQPRVPVSSSFYLSSGVIDPPLECVGYNPLIPWETSALFVLFCEIYRLGDNIDKHV